jgi:hypothetical protein
MKARVPRRSGWSGSPVVSVWRLAPFAASSAVWGRGHGGRPDRSGRRAGSGCRPRPSWSPGTRGGRPSPVPGRDGPWIRAEGRWNPYPLNVGQVYTTLQRLERDAERIVWNTLRYRFGVVTVSQTSGGCARGSFCESSSTEIASQTYAQLRGEFGPRPAGLDKTSVSQTDPMPSWLPGAVTGAAVSVVVVAVIWALRRRLRDSAVAA